MNWPMDDEIEICRGRVNRVRAAPVCSGSILVKDEVCTRPEMDLDRMNKVEKEEQDESSDDSEEEFFMQCHFLIRKTIMLTYKNLVYSVTF